MAVGIIAAQSIGEPGTQLTMRTFHIGGVATRGVEEKDVKAKRDGKVKYVGLNMVTNDEGKKIALSRNGEIQILDPKGRELEKYDVPDGAEMKVEDGQMVTRGTMLCEWDPHNIPILAEVGGKVRYEDIVENETMRIEIDPSGHTRRTIMEHKGDLHPQILIEDAEGHILAYNYIPEGAGIEVAEGATITAGTLLAKTPREVGGTQDITGGLPRVTELFEARRPKEPAVIAEIDGRVDLLDEKRRGKRTIIVKNESGIEREHLVPHGKYLRVHGGDRVRAGDALVEGPLVPHDILRISGEEAVQRYLHREIQNVYRSPARRDRRQAPGDHHRPDAPQGPGRVASATPGSCPARSSTSSSSGARTLELMSCVKIKDPGDTDFRQGDIVPRDHFDAENLRVEAAGGQEGRVDPAQAGRGEHPAPGDHQGRRAVRQLHLGRELPGDDQGAHRGRPGGQGRLPRRPQGERHPRATSSPPAPGSSSTRRPRSASAPRRSKPSPRRAPATAATPATRPTTPPPPPRASDRGATVRTPTPRRPAAPGPDGARAFSFQNGGTRR